MGKPSDCLGTPDHTPTTDAEGFVPADSINGLVAAQLIEMSTLRQSFAAGARRRRRERKPTDEAAGSGHED